MLGPAGWAGRLVVRQKGSSSGRGAAGPGRNLPSGLPCQPAPAITRLLAAHHQSPAARTSSGSSNSTPTPPTCDDVERGVEGEVGVIGLVGVAIAQALQQWVPRLHKRQRPRLCQHRAHVLAPAVRGAGAAAGGDQAEACQHVQQGNVVHQAVQQGQVVGSNLVGQPLQHLQGKRQCRSGTGGKN